MKIRIVLVAGLALVGAAVHADAASLNNTGLNPTLGGVDPYWTLAGTTSSAPTGVHTYDSISNGTFPQPPYIANSTTSGWATPLPAASPYPYDGAGGPGATYTFQTTFYTNTAALDSFTGQYAADNEVVLIKLNGATLYSNTPNVNATEYSYWTGFGAAPGVGFVNGLNTLQITVYNAPYTADYGNPIGLDVQFLTQNIGVPEPAAWALMLAGVGFAGAALRRARRQAPVAV
jgi:hypothetical protein